MQFFNQRTGMVCDGHVKRTAVGSKQSPRSDGERLVVVIVNSSSRE